MLLTFVKANVYIYQQDHVYCRELNLQGQHLLQCMLYNEYTTQYTEKCSQEELLPISIKYYTILHTFRCHDLHWQKLVSRTIYEQSRE